VDRNGAALAASPAFVWSVAVSAPPGGTLDDALGTTRASGFRGIELSATGTPNDLYAPAVTSEDRARLRDAVSGLAVAVRAPTQATFDVSLVSPSAAIRRASVAEIWSACRLVGALGGGVVLVRSGVAPDHVTERQQQVFLAQCLQTLDRVAGDHHARIAVEMSDFFARPDRCALLDVLPLKNVGLAFGTGGLSDVANGAGALTVRGGIGAFVARAAPRLRYVRLRPRDEAAGLLGEIGVALRAAGYAGMVCGAFPADDPVATRDRWQRRLNGKMDDD
jgi:hypothetical protein